MCSSVFVYRSVVWRATAQQCGGRHTCADCLISIDRGFPRWRRRRAGWAGHRYPLILFTRTGEPGLGKLTTHGRRPCVCVGRSKKTMSCFKMKSFPFKRIKIAFRKWYRIRHVPRKQRASVRAARVLSLQTKPPQKT